MPGVYIELVNFDFSRVTTFEWDVGNLTKSQLKHGVSPAETEQLFFNQPLYVEDREHSEREPRWRAYGRTDAGRLIVCAFTVRGTRLRPISARPMSRKERRFYAQALRQTGTETQSD